MTHENATAPLRLYSFRGENFMGLKVVETSFDDEPITRITGENGEGKTSFINAIATGLGGAQLAPDRPIRNGEREAKVTVDLGEMIVTRRWWLDDSDKLFTEIEAKSPAGRKLKSPQGLLNEIIGKLSFDPLEFKGQHPLVQVDTLKKLVGLDFTLLDNQRKTHFDCRTIVNRELDGLKGQLEMMKLVNAPADKVDVAQLLAQQKVAIAEQRAYDGLKRAAEDAARQREQADKRVAEKKAALLRAQAELADAEAAAVMATDAEEEAVGAFDMASAPGLAAINAQLESAEQTNELVRQKKAREEVHTKLRAAEKETEQLTEAIREIDQNKKDALAAAKFPVPGLSFDEQTVTFEGVPFKQVNTAMQIRTSVAIGIELAGRLKLMLIREGASLTETSMKMIAEMAAAAACMILIERPGTGESGIRISDGEIAEDTRIRHDYTERDDDDARDGPRPAV